MLKIKRRLHGAVLLLFFLSTYWYTSGITDSADSRRPARPNVVLISIDTLRFDHLGLYGYKKPTSPNIDAFAKDTVIFEQAIAHAPSTLSSHASILSALLPDHHHASIAQRTPVPENVETIAEILKQHGYATASFNGGIQLDRIWGLAQGFDVYYSVKPEGSGAATLAGSENSFNAITQKAFPWITACNKPFFLFLHTYETHHPYTPRRPLLRIFETAYGGTLPDRIAVDLLVKINKKEISLSAEDLQHIISAYDAEVRSVDEAFGRLISFLKSSGLYDNSVIIFTSDHGEEFAEHGTVGWHSHTLYDELLRVPLLIKLPLSRMATTKIKQQVRGIDIAPTVVALLGIKKPGQFEGVDLLTYIKKPDSDLPAVSKMDTGAGANIIALRVNGWKLYGETLFDLGKDPGETIDAAKQYPLIAQNLHVLLDRQLAAKKNFTGKKINPDQKAMDQLRSLGYTK